MSERRTTSICTSRSDLDLHAERAAQEAERAYERVSGDLRHNLAFRVPIFLFRTTTEFDGSVHTVASPGAAGELSSGDRILLAIDQPADRWPGLITHEVAHVFAFDILPGRSTATWVLEGLAEYERGAWDPAICRHCEMRCAPMPSRR